MTDGNNTHIPHRPPPKGGNKPSIEHKGEGPKPFAYLKSNSLDQFLTKLGPYVIRKIYSGVFLTKAEVTSQ